MGFNCSSSSPRLTCYICSSLLFFPLACRFYESSSSKFEPEELTTHERERERERERVRARPFLLMTPG